MYISILYEILYISNKILVKKINKEKCTISRVQIEERKFEGEKNHERESRELIRPIKEKQCAFYTAKTPT